MAGRGCVTIEDHESDGSDSSGDEVEIHSAPMTDSQPSPQDQQQDHKQDHQQEQQQQQHGDLEQQLAACLRTITNARAEAKIAGLLMLTKLLRLGETARAEEEASVAVGGGGVQVPAGFMRQLVDALTLRFLRQLLCSPRDEQRMLVLSLLRAMMVEEPELADKLGSLAAELVERVLAARRCAPDSGKAKEADVAAVCLGAMLADGKTLHGLAPSSCVSVAEVMRFMPSEAGKQGCFKLFMALMSKLAPAELGETASVVVPHLALVFSGATSEVKFATLQAISNLLVRWRVNREMQADGPDSPYGRPGELDVLCPWALHVRFGLQAILTSPLDDDSRKAALKVTVEMLERFGETWASMPFTKSLMQRTETDPSMTYEPHTFVVILLNVIAAELRSMLPLPAAKKHLGTPFEENAALAYMADTVPMCFRLLDLTCQFLVEDEPTRYSWSLFPSETVLTIRKRLRECYTAVLQFFQLSKDVGRKSDTLTYLCADTVGKYLRLDPSAFYTEIIELLPYLLGLRTKDDSVFCALLDAIAPVIDQPEVMRILAEHKAHTRLVGLLKQDAGYERSHQMNFGRVVSSSILLRMVIEQQPKMVREVILVDALPTLAKVTDKVVQEIELYEKRGVLLPIENFLFLAMHTSVLLSRLLQDSANTDIKGAEKLWGCVLHYTQVSQRILLQPHWQLDQLDVAQWTQSLYTIGLQINAADTPLLTAITRVQPSFVPACLDAIRSGRVTANEHWDALNYLLNALATHIPSTRSLIFSTINSLDTHTRQRLPGLLTDP